MFHQGSLIANAEVIRSEESVDDPNLPDDICKWYGSFSILKVPSVLLNISP